MKILSKFLLLILVLAAFAPPARADYFVWRDTKTGLSLTLPDTWRVVSNEQAGDVVTVMAPSGRANAVCRVSAAEDRRFVIYPRSYASDIQRLAVGRDFWERYLARYDDSRIEGFRDGAGLGQGFASYAEASYDSSVPGPEMPRRALMFASLYGGTMYVVECSAHRDAFARWKNAFLNIAGSVDLKSAYGPSLHGYYRDFTGDPRIEFPDANWRGTELY